MDREPSLPAPDGEPLANVQTVAELEQQLAELYAQRTDPRERSLLDEQWLLTPPALAAADAVAERWYRESSSATSYETLNRELDAELTRQGITRAFGLRMGLLSILFNRHHPLMRLDRARFITEYGRDPTGQWLRVDARSDSWTKVAIARRRYQLEAEGEQ